MTAQERKAARYSRQCERRRDARSERRLAFSLVLFALALLVKLGVGV